MKSILATIGLLAALFVPPSGVCAIEPTDLEQARADFLAAENALAKGDRNTFIALTKQLQDYPLHPYLQFEDLRRRLASADEEEIRGFIANFADTPLAARLQHQWLRQLAARKDWNALIDNYVTTSDTTLECRYRAALLRLDRIEAAFAGLENLWLTARSQPSACDVVFRAWYEHGGLDQDMVWQRFELAMGVGERRLAYYLVRFMGPPFSDDARLWIDVQHHPALVLTDARLQISSARRATIFAYALRRLAYQAPDSALTAWARFKVVYPAQTAMHHGLASELGLAFAVQGRSDAMTWLAGVDPAYEDGQIRQWRIRVALARQDWYDVLNWINWLDAEERGEARWRYWKARSLEALGFQREARAVYLGLAGSRNYYGFLASDRLDLPYHFEETPLSFSAEELQTLARRPAFARARELFALGRTVDARREWNLACANQDDDALMRAAKLAQQWGWHSQAILTTARAEHWDDLEMRFPLAHYDAIISNANSQHVEPAWVYAILRQESAFMHDARSPAGALGLMQLLPRTGREVARLLNQRLNSADQLLSSDLNIQFGTAYLRLSLDWNDNNPVLATAAYNAGLQRVRRWLPEDGGSVPADIWVETIPVQETRDYLRRVLSYTVIYQQRLGYKQSSLAKLMAPIPPAAVFN